MLEKEIEKKVCSFAYDLGWLHYKFVSPNKRGVPDRIFFRRGKCIFIEFKSKGKKPTALQVHHMKLLQEQHFMTFVVDNVYDGYKIFEELV